MSDTEFQPWQRHVGFARRTALADRVAARAGTLVDASFGAALIARWSSADATGRWAAVQAQRLAIRPSSRPLPAMDVAPFVPPQRQLNAARQGAAAWTHSPPTPAQPFATAAAATPAFADEARARLDQGRDINTVRRELEALGWKLT